MNEPKTTFIPPILPNRPSDPPLTLEEYEKTLAEDEEYEENDYDLFNLRNDIEFAQARKWHIRGDIPFTPILLQRRKRVADNHRVAVVLSPLCDVCHDRILHLSNCEICPYLQRLKHPNNTTQKLNTQKEYQLYYALSLLAPQAWSVNTVQKIYTDVIAPVDAVILERNETSKVAYIMKSLRAIDLERIAEEYIKTVSSTKSVSSSIAEIWEYQQIIGRHQTSKSEQMDAMVLLWPKLQNTPLGTKLKNEILKTISTVKITRDSLGNVSKDIIKSHYNRLWDALSLSQSAPNVKEYEQIIRSHRNTSTSAKIDAMVTLWGTLDDRNNVEQKLKQYILKRVSNDIDDITQEGLKEALSEIEESKIDSHYQELLASAKNVQEYEKIIRAPGQRKTSTSEKIDATVLLWGTLNDPKRIETNLRGIIQEFFITKPRLNTLSDSVINTHHRKILEAIHNALAAPLRHKLPNFQSLYARIYRSNPLFTQDETPEHVKRDVIVNFVNHRILDSDLQQFMLREIREYILENEYIRSSRFAPIITDMINSFLNLQQCKRDLGSVFSSVDSRIDAMFSLLATLKGSPQQNAITKDLLRIVISFPTERHLTNPVLTKQLSSRINTQYATAWNIVNEILNPPFQSLSEKVFSRQPVAESDPISNIVHEISKLMILSADTNQIHILYSGILKIIMKYQGFTWDPETEYSDEGLYAKTLRTPLLPNTKGDRISDDAIKSRLRRQTSRAERAVDVYWDWIKNSIQRQIRKMIRTLQRPKDMFPDGEYITKFLNVYDRDVGRIIIYTRNKVGKLYVIWDTHRQMDEKAFGFAVIGPEIPVLELIWSPEHPTDRYLLIQSTDRRGRRIKKYNTSTRVTLNIAPVQDEDDSDSEYSYIKQVQDQSRWKTPKRKIGFGSLGSGGSSSGWLGSGSGGGPIDIMFENPVIVPQVSAYICATNSVVQIIRRALPLIEQLKTRQDLRSADRVITALRALLPRSEKQINPIPAIFINDLWPSLSDVLRALHNSDPKYVLERILAISPYISELSKWTFKYDEGVELEDLTNTIFSNNTIFHFDDTQTGGIEWGKDQDLVKDSDSDPFDLKVAGIRNVGSPMPPFLWIYTEFSYGESPGLGPDGKALPAINKKITTKAARNYRIGPSVRMNGAEFKIVGVARHPYHPDSTTADAGHYNAWVANILGSNNGKVYDDQNYPPFAERLENIEYPYLALYAQVPEGFGGVASGSGGSSGGGSSGGGSSGGGSSGGGSSGGGSSGGGSSGGGSSGGGSTEYIRFTNSRMHYKGAVCATNAIVQVLRGVLPFLPPPPPRPEDDEMIVKELRDIQPSQRPQRNPIPEIVGVANLPSEESANILEKILILSPNLTRLSTWRFRQEKTELADDGTVFVIPEEMKTLIFYNKPTVPDKTGGIKWDGDAFPHGEEDPFDLNALNTRTTGIISPTYDTYPHFMWIVTLFGDFGDSGIRMLASEYRLQTRLRMNGMWFHIVGVTSHSGHNHYVAWVANEFGSNQGKIYNDAAMPDEANLENITYPYLALYSREREEGTGGGGGGSSGSSSSAGGGGSSSSAGGGGGGSGGSSSSAGGGGGGSGGSSSSAGGAGGGSSGSSAPSTAIKPEPPELAPPLEPPTRTRAPRPQDVTIVSSSSDRESQVVVNWIPSLPQKRRRSSSRDVQTSKGR